jgi:hypothetical protein
MPLATAQIGRAGELLVQYRLLLLGIESAPMSTDSGIDLVAYSPMAQRPRTVQVKANLKAKPGGGKGKAALDWWVPEDTPAELIALVDLSEQRLWIFERTEFSRHAQQHSGGRHHIYMYTDPAAKPRKMEKAVHVHEFQRYLVPDRKPARDLAIPMVNGQSGAISQTEDSTQDDLIASRRGRAVGGSLACAGASPVHWCSLARLGAQPTV